MNIVEHTVRKMLKAGALVNTTLSAVIESIDADRADHEETIRSMQSRFEYDEDVVVDDEPDISVADKGVWVGAMHWVDIEDDEDVASIDEEAREKEDAHEARLQENGR